MCGICGIINKERKPVSNDDILKMMRVMKYRGPDDEGVFLKDNIGLGHIRLSIIDLSAAGHQPMFDQSGRYCIVYNGEIYNYLELRKELGGKYNFISQTDTEVILYAYREWGVDCLNHFNGMFAFAIYDTEQRIIFLARDRFGIKPLYYFRGEDTFIFASEIKSILRIIPAQKILNDIAIFDYLVYNRTDQYTDTFFRNIKRLDHGHYILVENGNFSIKRWYRLSERLNKQIESAEHFKHIFVDSVRLRLRSDVPVGVCLSGGLDSSSIASVLTKILRKGDLQTFSAVYGRGEIGDETEYIDLYKKSVFRMHKTTPSALTLFRDLKAFIDCQGEPVPSTGPYAQFKVMELARGNVTVLLDGQGGDELLAGYHYFFGNYFRELLSYWRFLKLIEESYLYYERHRSSFAFQSLVFYLLPNSMKTRARLVGRDYLNRDFYEKEKDKSRLSETLFNARSLKEALLFHFEYKLEHLLKWEDRNSMWFSLESRVPFLDHRLVEGVLGLASQKIINHGMTKYILRKAMEGIIPEKIRLRQDKLGFMTPDQRWFRHPVLKKFVSDLINSESFRQRHYLDQGRCLKLFDLHTNGKVNISRDIWKWLNLELWFRRMEL